MTENQTTYQLRCACPLCGKTRKVTLPAGKKPKEFCSGEIMLVENSWPAGQTPLSTRH